MEWHLESEGLSDFRLRFRAVADFREKIIDAMEFAADAAGQYMGTHVPYHSGSIYRAINVGPVRYMPGGAGGGGFYEVNVGVNKDEAPHVEAVIDGTGIYARDGGGPIFPANGNVMVFTKLGEGKVFTRWTKGQEPQRAWFEDAQALASRLVAERISSM